MPSPTQELSQSGFTVVRGLLPKVTVSEALESVRRTVTDQLRHLGMVAPADLHHALRALHGADIDRYKKTIAALWRKADIAATMKHKTVTGFLKEHLGWNDVFLPGGDVVLLMANDLKIPGGYFGLRAHQDFPSVQGSLDGLVAWIPLTDAGSDNFPLEVVAGSHRLGLVTDVEETANGWQIPDTQLKDLIPIEAKAGDVVFMSYFTVHRSGLNGNRLRIALSTRFDNASEKTFVDRAYPTAYQRSVHRDQYVKGFPKLEDLAPIWG